MTPEPFCTHCGALLLGPVERCPSCGAPLVASKPAPSNSRTLTAGVLLVSLFALSVFQAVVVFQSPLPVSGGPLDLGSFPVEGTVFDAEGATVANASVVATDGTNATSGPDGRYRIANLSAGVQELRFNASGHANQTLRIVMLRAQTADAHLPPLGESKRQDHPSVAPVLLAAQICGGFLIVFGLVTILGAIACFKRRRWGLAMAGAILSLFASVPLSLIIGAIAVALVASARKSFQR